MGIPLWFEIGTYAVLILVLAFDVFWAYRNPRIPSTAECIVWIGVYVGLALLFAALLLFAVDSPAAAAQFVTGWLTEYSLSVDNLFVFLLIMASFKVPRMYQQPILMIGIILSLVFRGVFILLGAALIQQFSWIFYIFGAFLLYTAFQQAFSGRSDEEQTHNRIVRIMRRMIPIVDDYDGSRLRTVIDGKRVWTPVILVIAALGVTNVIFALDSIPAIFGITTNAFLVFATNVFALMGLRQLYFLLGGLVDKLQYLKYGISFILAFIGANLVLHAMHENELSFINGGHHLEWAPEIPTWVSLLVIIGSMLLAVLASLVKIHIDLKAGRITPEELAPDPVVPETAADGDTVAITEAPMAATEPAHTAGERTKST